MNKRKLGKNGPMVPGHGLGAAATHRDNEVMIELVDAGKGSSPTAHV